MKIISSIFVLLFLITFVTASQNSLGTFKQGEDITLLQICGTCTYNNITSIVLPNSSHLVIDQEMTKRGMEYTYQFNNTQQLGVYSVNGFGDLDGTDNAWAYDFEITYTGAQKINDGEGMVLLITTLTILALAIFFFILGFRTRSPTISLIFVALAGVFLFITVMSTLNFVVENLGHLGNSVEGYSAFLLVVKSIVSIAITVLTLWGLWKAYKSFSWARGMTR